MRFVEETDVWLIVEVPKRPNTEREKLTSAIKVAMTPLCTEWLRPALNHWHDRSDGIELNEETQQWFSEAGKVARNHQGAPGVTSFTKPVRSCRNGGERTLSWRIF